MLIYASSNPSLLELQNGCELPCLIKNDKCALGADNPCCWHMHVTTARCAPHRALRIEQCTIG